MEVFGKKEWQDSINEAYNVSMALPPLALISTWLPPVRRKIFVSTLALSYFVGKTEFTTKWLANKIIIHRPSFFTKLCV
jgi:hypothetical protein